MANAGTLSSPAPDATSIPATPTTPAARPVEIDVSRSVWPLSMFDGALKIAPFGKSSAAIESVVDQYARSLGDEAQITSARSPVEGRLYYYGGHVVGWVGLILAAAGLAQVARPDHYEVLFGAFGLGLLMILASAPLLRRGRDILNPSAAEHAAADRRRPILLLASFRNKDTEIVADAEAQGQARPTAVADTIGLPFRRFGPFEALPRPTDDAPVEGQFGQLRLDSVVGPRMDSAFLILAVPAAGSAVAGEVQHLIARRHEGKLLVLMPPVDGIWPWDGTVEDANDEELRQRRVDLEAALNWRPKGGSATAWDRTKQRLRSRSETEEALRQQRWSTLREALRDCPGFASLPVEPPPRVIAVFTDRDGRPVILNGPKVPTGRDYLRALTIAVYGMKCHARA